MDATAEEHADSKGAAKNTTAGYEEAKGELASATPSRQESDSKGPNAAGGGELVGEIATGQQVAGDQSGEIDMHRKARKKPKRRTKDLGSLRKALRERETTEDIGKSSGGGITHNAGRAAAASDVGGGARGLFAAFRRLPAPGEPRPVPALNLTPTDDVATGLATGTVRGAGFIRRGAGGIFAAFRRRPEPIIEPSNAPVPTGGVSGLIAGTVKGAGFIRTPRKH